jgi:SAM-dependent methyltransferase
MNHADHVTLIRAGVTQPGGTWADFGSGGGAFTLALADLLGPGATIYSIDRDTRAISEQEREMRARFPQTRARYITADFTKPLDLAPLDGIVMANSLHFVRAKAPVLQRIRAYLRPGGTLILVEYNADHGNLWVPHPLSYPAWEKLAIATGFKQTRLLATIPSRFLREIYAAASQSVG